MVSLRCKLLVIEELNKLEVDFISVDLGTIELYEDLTDEKKSQFRDRLKASGLELLDNKKNILVEKIKCVIIEMVHYEEDEPKVNYSDYISSKLGYDYTYLSNVFSEVKGINIQQYIILHKIERVKELLLYDELTLTEIAYQMHYSSVSHLSNQFKKITGLTPTYFKELKHKREKYLENL